MFMKTRKRTLWHSILTVVFTASLLLGNLVLFMPTASAVAATSVITSVTFQGAQAGPVALDQHALVNFTEPVCGNADCSAGLTLSNFTYTDTDTPTGFSTITAVTHTAGNDWALLDFGETSTSADIGDFVRAEDIYTASGMLLSDSSLSTSPHGIGLTSDTTDPTILVATSRIEKTGADDDIVLVNFSEPVGDETGAEVVVGDFAYGDGNTATADGFNSLVVSADYRWGIFATEDGGVPAVQADADIATGTGDTIDKVDNQLFDLIGNEYDSADGIAAIEFFAFADEDTTAPTITSAYGQIGNDVNGGNDMVLVTFDEPVFNAADAGAAANLETTDFVWVASGGAETLAAITQHTGGDTMAVLDFSANLIGMGTIDSAAGDTAVYDAFGNAMATGTPDTVDDNTFPILRGVWVNQFIDHQSDAPDASPTAVGTNTAVTVVAVTTEATVGYPQDGSRMLKLTDETALAAAEGFMSPDLNVDLYDTTNDLYEFTQVKFDAYYEDADANLTLDSDTDIAFVLNDAADFTTASVWNITTDLADAGGGAGDWTTVTIDLTADVSSGTALASQVANPQFWGIQVIGTTDIATSDDLYIDNVRFSRGASSKSNQVILEYSESVDLTGDPAEGASAASATTAGDMITSKTLAGLGAFASGTLTMPTTTNTVEKSADGTTYTISLADQDGGLITQASPVTLTGLFTPTTNVTDIDANAMVATSTHTPETVIDALDLTTAATAVTDFTILSVGNGTLDLSWTPPTQTAATFSHYAALYGTSSGVTVASTLWDDTDDAALAGPTISTSSITGLTNATAYFVNLGGVDAKGNITSLVTEMSGTPSANSGGGGSSTGSGPGAPTSFTGSVDENMHVVLTWTDPANIDLESIQVIRSKGEGIEPGTVLATVNAGTEAYTDEDVAEGEVVNYQVRGKDNDGAFGTVTETLSLTIEAGATSVTPDVVEPTPAEEPAVEEPAAEEAVAEEATAGISFTDTGGHWGEAEIEAMAELNIAEGDPEGTFRPDGELNRAEAAALLYRVLGYVEPTAPDAEPFPDVPVDQWYSGYISNMKALELIHGYGDGLYRPGKDINRAEFVKIALGVYYTVADEETRLEIDALMEGEKTTAYNDLEDDWYTPHVTTATEIGFVHGFGCGTGKCFGAENNITRAEATVILYNMFYTILTEAAAAEAVDEAAVADDTVA